jgi:Flp pilus assembly pilin Flp
LTARRSKGSVDPRLGAAGKASLLGLLRRVSSDEGGATIVEHAILVCVIALVIVSLVGSGLTPSTVLRSVAYIADSVVTGGGEASATRADPPAVGE